MKSTKLDYPGLTSQAFLAGDEEAGRALKEIEEARQALVLKHNVALYDVIDDLENGVILAEDLAEVLVDLCDVLESL